MGISDIITSTAYNKYEDKLEKEVLEGRIPQHIAIIMDGNRRYAEEVMKSDASEGHIKGKEKLEEVVNWCYKAKVRMLTVYAFSTENFSRSDEEVDFLLNMIKDSLMEFADDPRIHGHKVRLKVIGDRDMLSPEFMKAVDYAEEKTKDYSDFGLNMAIAYGGRQEIISAVKEIAQKVKDGEMNVEDIDEKAFSLHMYTSDTPDPDLVLRTSGEIRVSNFLLWQMAYSELYFTDIYWPGFRYIDFLRAIRSYQQRMRRFGV
ncbi:MAG: polyprenyl diphosphate synthase [Candidatus Methanomethylophilaceae archaeon]|jgi:tritrans,polycis-undecaprenyl-diphosphate synthase [geranylgeranyl-diphosphate specific]